MLFIDTEDKKRAKLHWAREFRFGHRTFAVTLPGLRIIKQGVVHFRKDIFAPEAVHNVIKKSFLLKHP